MFENAPSTKLGKRLGHKQQSSSVQTGSIYNDLKLTDQLNDTLGVVRNEVTFLTSSLENEQNSNRMLTS